jgi:Arf-GAP with SH3 domain, ANK repeat and PH domain-containing protein
MASVTITNARNRTLLQISPGEYPATRYLAKRDGPDETPVEYVLVSP